MAQFVNAIINFITHIGEKGVTVINALGRSVIMLFQALVRLPKFTNLPLLVKQLFSVGVLSLPIILVAALFIGMVLGLQLFTILTRFGAEAALGQGAALVLVRELGPVVTALLFAGRAGSAVTAEIGLMKATEQLSSLELMGVDPLQRVIAPRFWAGVISMPLLAIMFSAVGILGAYLVGVDWLGVYAGSFWSSMQQAVDFQQDILNGFIKSIVFALAIIWIAVYQGYECFPNSEGISRATTRTVVFGSLSVLGLDFLLTALMFGDF